MHANNYRDCATLINALLDYTYTEGRRVSGHVRDNYRYLIILDWPGKHAAPTLTLRDLEADTEAGYQDTAMAADAENFKTLYLVATR